jgi:RecB family exonuclease
MKISLRGCFWSHWIPSLQTFDSSSNIAHGTPDQHGFLNASLWRNILLRGFLEDFETACERGISHDSSIQCPEFKEALENGLLNCDFDSTICLHHGIEVTTLEHPELAIGAHVWVAGLTRESLPGSMLRNPVFPREAAEELQAKLATAGCSVKLQLARSMSSFLRESQRNLLDVLARSKQDLLGSCATKASRNEPIAESPLFRALMKVALTERRSTQRSIECVDFIHPISFTKGESLPSTSPQIPAKHSLNPFPISATALAEFIQCPRKFFYEQIVGLEIPERPVVLLVGLLLHEAMAHFLAAGTEPKAPEAPVVAEWIQDFCQSHDEFSSLSEGVRFTMVRFVAKALNEFFASEEVWQGDISEVERAFELSLPGGFSVRGRIDRIDLTAEGLEVIDYKSRRSFASAKLKDELLKAEEWIQLPIYVKAAEALFNQPVTKASIIFFGLKGKDKPRRTTARITEESRHSSQMKRSRDLVCHDELDETWTRICRTVETIFREDQAFGRGENPPCEKSSLGCPFIRICPVARSFDEESKEDNA